MPLCQEFMAKGQTGRELQLCQMPEHIGQRGEKPHGLRDLCSAGWKVLASTERPSPPWNPGPLREAETAPSTVRVPTTTEPAGREEAALLLE